MVATRRKSSVSFADFPIEEPRVRTRSGRQSLNASASPAKSLLKKREVEADGALRFTRKSKKAKKAAADEAGPAPPAAAAAASAVPPPPAPAAAPSPAAPPAPAAAPASAAAPTAEPVVLRRTLDGASPAFLEAVLEACQSVDTSNPAMRAVTELCVDELRRMGITQAAPAGANAQLAARERALQQRLEELHEAHGQWKAITAASLSPATEADVEALEIEEADLRELEEELPPPPPLEQQIGQLRMYTALCADQIEAAVKQAARVCAQGDSLRQTICKNAHQQAFAGYLDVNQPRNLLRSIVSGV